MQDIFYHPISHYFIIQMDWKKQINMDCFLLLVLLLPLVNTQSCAQVVANGWVNTTTWTSCYENRNGLAIGNILHSYPSCRGIWDCSSYADYDYNNYISFYAPTTPASTIRNDWGTNIYHSTGWCSAVSTCGDSACGTKFADGCNVQNINDYDGNGNSCYQYQCDLRPQYRVDIQLWLPCHFLCNTCTAKWDPHSCQSCRNDGYGQSHLWLNIPGSSTNFQVCDNWCPDTADNTYKGQFIASTSDLTCTFCDSKCSWCAGTSTTCFRCVNGYYLWQNWTDAGYNSVKTCDSYCPKRSDYLQKGQYIALTTDGSCSWCHSYCSWCAGTSTTCFSCVTGYHLWQNWTDAGFNSYTKCASYCPRRDDYLYPGQYFANANDLQCSFCSPLCAWCDNGNSGTKCFTCVTNAYLRLNWTDITSYSCATTCPKRTTNNLYPGQYINSPTDKNCTFCNAKCTWCADVAGGNVCFSCTQNNYLWQNWTDAGFNSYTKCDSYCPRRDDYLYPGQYIAVTTDGSCSFCSPLCAWCDNGNSGTKCFTCVTNAYLRLNWTDITSYSCATTCPKRTTNNLYPGQYINSPTDKNCTFCNAKCTWCADVAGGNVCFSCTQNNYLWQNWTDAGFNSYTKCDSYCPRRDDYLYPGQYIAVTTDGSCSFCSPLCAWCDNGNSGTKCFTCVTNAYLRLNWTDITSYSCATTCPKRTTNNLYPGQYINSPTDKNCTFCNAKCTWCADVAGGNVCFSCTQNNYLWQNWTDAGFNSYTKCDSYCPRRDDYLYPGQYIAVTTDGSCSFCSPLCAWCDNGNSGTKCFTCVTNAYLRLNWTDITSYSCATTCPKRTTNNLYPGQYINSPTDKNCTFCNAKCTWCADVAGGNVCFSCTQNNYLWQNWTDAGFNSYTHCDYYCPRRNDYLYKGQYIAVTTDGSCSWCHSYCSWCDNGNSGTKCFTCVKTVAWLQLNWTDVTSYTCAITCPRRTDNVYRGQYIAASTDLNCTWCNSTCSWCENYSGGNKCYTCITTAYLLVNNAQCMSSFPFDNGFCYPDYQCINTNCPTNLYFELAQGSTSSATYPWTANNASTWMRQTNVCYLCHVYCLECTNKYDYTCTKCAGSYYQWRQSAYTLRCNYYCNEGNYTQGGLMGEYVDPTTSVPNRQCAICSTGCQFCANAAAQCYICQDNYFLLDDKESCAATFTCPQCKLTAQGGAVTDGCASANKYCRINNCPVFFYFPLYMATTGGAGDTLVTNPRYDHFTNASSLQNTVNGYEAAGTTRTSPSDYISPTPNTNILYRRKTNLCKLCDYRCMKCFGPSNFNCTLCIDNYFLWTNAPVCESYCPTGQYQLNISASYPTNATQCGNCNNLCIACIGYAGNCTSCKIFPATNYAYLYSYVSSNSTCMTSCPTSSSPLTVKGYYGSIGTMVCYACPGYCSNCNINYVVTNYLILQPIVCASDNYCSKGIQCTDCLQGYSFVSGTCVSQTTCRLYSYYQMGNSSSTWSPTNCICLDGYYFSSYLTCTICHVSCLTCSGASSSNCLTCYQGYALSGNTCSQSQVVLQSSWETISSSVAVTSSLSNTYNFYASCGTYYTLYGYQNTPTTNDYFQYNTLTITNPNYYGISFQLNVLFIDNWDTTAGLYFRLDSPTAYPSYTYTYNTKGAIGEQQCGTNAFDYFLRINGKILMSPTTTNTIHSIYISANKAPVQNTTGFYYMFGIKNAVFTILKCHTDCSQCTGPANTQCTICSNSTKKLVNGSCVCNSTANYFVTVGNSATCDVGCPACTYSYTTNSTTCYYRDYTTNTCVNPPIKNCSAPFTYGYPYQLTNGYGTCVQNCTSGTYSVPYLLKCTSDCSKFNLYFYNGSSSQGATMSSCVSACPSQMIANPSTMYCVNRCPASSYLKLQNRTTNPTCTNNCTTGYQNDNSNQCVTSCPNSYYTQTQSSHNKCTQVCIGAFFGDNVTGSCVNFCPSPSLADPTTHLCVNTCPTGYYVQVTISNGNRTCVTQCQNGQYLNPYYLNCSTNPKDCPIGTYADTNTHKCQYRCTVSGEVGQNSTQLCQTSCFTGYAYWAINMCVNICPSNISLFGYINGNTRICVASCNSTTTGLFGDVQANQTCVQKCSATPQSTFGDKGTNLCVKTCPVSNQYGDPNNINRQCVTICSNFPTQTFSFYVTKLCVAVCPQGFYGDNYTTTSVGVCATGCPSPYFGSPVTNLCVSKCPFGYFGSPLTNRPCVQVCPFGYYGSGNSTQLCVTDCGTGYWADQVTNLCYNVKTSCSNYTYADPIKKLCVVGTNCTGGTYADPLTMGCSATCSNTSYFGDPSSNLCVTLCPFSPDYYSQAGLCTGTCTGSFFADWQANRTCVSKCSTSPIPLYGTSTFRCVNSSQCYSLGLFGNNNSQLCSACSGTLPYGDPISFQCVAKCQLTYYGDLGLNLCVLTCNITNLLYADNITGTCTLLCTLGTYGVNGTIPVCQGSCPPNSYALDTFRVCVSNCTSGYFGDPLTGKCYSSALSCSTGYYGNSVTNMCVLPVYCQVVGGNQYYADNTTKMCIVKCTSPNYGLNTTRVCVAKCSNPYYGESTSRTCVVVGDCGIYLSFADSQLNLCVSQCSTTPIFTYSQNSTYTCVVPANCPANMFAENISQSCVSYCPHNTTYYSYADSYKTRRCLAKCFDLYYGDNSLGYGICTPSCPTLNYFRDTSTQLCVYVCPAANSALGTPNTFGDNTTDFCVQQCPINYFAQVQINRTCVLYCQGATWGNIVSRTCINNPVTSCQPGTWADSFTNLCTSQCSSNSSNGQLFYGQNTTRLCIAACPSPSFAYSITRVCIDICPVTITNSPGYFGDSGTTPTRLCVTNCLTTGLYRDTANNRTCQATCTFNSVYKTYRDPTTMTCVASCPRYPQYLYAQGTSSTNAQCASTCSTGYMYDANMSCIASCPGLLDPTTNRCVQQCPYNSNSNTYLYANMVSMTCVAASACPGNTYASDDLLQCVSTCPNNTYIYQKNCVAFCPNGFYMNLNNQSCVTASACPSSYFANNQTLTCVVSCTNGTFGDTLTRMCLTQCYGTNYADPITGLCSSACSTGLIKNTLLLTCVGNCASGYFYNPVGSSCTTSCTSPYYANTATSSCVTMCTANPMTFASVTPTRACVTTCPSSAQWFDLVNRVCTANCPTGTFQYSLNVSCVALCPPPYFKLSTACVLNCSSSSWYADSTTRNCVPTCPTGYFRDPTTFKCVLTCPVNPVMYYSSTSTKNCETSCPSGYADSVTGSCVSQCSTSPLTYAEPNLLKCVSMCPVAYFQFADPASQKCVTICPNNTFADNRQRQCLSSCGNIFFADSLTNPPSCVSSCTSTTYADPLLFKCVTSCSPSYFTYSVNNTCLQFCPYGFFADPSTNSCKTQCQNVNYQYADSLTHRCQSVCSNNQYSYKQTGLSYGVCSYYCPGGFFSDPTTMKCVSKCPNGLFGLTTNYTCIQTCPQSQFMDSINNLCQVTCPSANSLFGQPFSRQCVTACNSTGYNFLFADSLASLCATTCSGSQFADPVTLKCVTSTGCFTGTVSDPYYKLCVSRCYNLTYAYSGTCWTTCPLATLYADEASQSCVVATLCGTGTYADPTKQRCVLYCDISSGRYANAGTKKCQTGCISPLFADNITRTCASTCTSVPIYFGLNNSQICVMNCPSLSFGDPTINLCVLKCSNGYFGNSLLNICVTFCPSGYFADNSTNMCVPTCPSTNPVYYGDHFTRTCVFNCTLGLFADTSNNRECHLTCLSPLFSQNSTRLCVTFCVTGFANPITRQCIANCSSGYYGFSLICYPSQCPSATPIVYADDSTNLCVTRCPNGSYGQPNSRKCVKICPISSNMFSDLVNNVCVYGCVSTYADSSIRACVANCSAIPALFSFHIGNVCVVNCTNGLYADNSTRSCSAGCPNGTYADNSTYTCVSMCPTSPMMWGNNVTNNCVFYCPAAYDRYADNSSRTCVSYCPNNSFADPTTYRCRSTCPANYFGVNSTWRCQLNCPSNSYADTLTRLCVAQCSIDPIFYGLPGGNNTCVPVCPTNYFGNPLTQQCVPNVGNSSGCPSSYFADSTSQICVQACPMKHNLYAQPISKACKSACVPPYFADNSTMKCVLKCPSYPSYFGDSSTQKCVSLCANGSFAQNSSRTCMSNCPNGSYSQNSTRRCVTACPNIPLSFRNSLTWQCVAQCPPSYFSDFINLLCIPSCSPADSVSGSTFARNDTHECVKVCPIGTFAYTPTLTCVANCFNNTYADNFSRTCQAVCPRSPALYAFNNTMTCLLKCPNGLFAFDNTRQCVSRCPDLGYFRQNSSQSCVQHCNYAQGTYADVLSGYCVNQCSLGYFADPTKMFCVLVCPDQPPMFAQNLTRTCVSVCPDNSFGDNSTQICVAKCPSGSLSLTQTHLCVFQCPLGYYAYKPTQFCLTQCTSPYYGDPSTRSCVLQCPQNQLLYSDNSTRSCVYTCPPGSYAYQWLYACLPNCPIASAPYVQTYAADYDNTCVPQCSYPFFSYDPLFKCLAQCPNPYFNSLQLHECQICPTSCSICTSLTQCTTCVLGYYLQNGACVTSCTLIYYANPTTQLCVVSFQCKPLFGINSTRTCATGCPIGQFPNTLYYRCDACPQTCVSCTSLGNCLGCVTNSVSLNNVCYGFCNISGISNGTNTTFKYFSKDNKTCVASCPNGTYESIVYCLACGSACATCSESADQCLSCANGRYVLNGSCLTSCPSGYKPVVTLNCVFCGGACGAGLTYKTNVTTINGQTSVFMNFNADVSFSGNLYNTIQVQSSRRLLANAATVGYQIVVIDAQTVQIIFPPGSTRTNFNVKITNPQNIVSASGELPASLVSDIQLDIKNFYATSSSTSSSPFPLYFTFLAIVSVISFLYDLQLMKFLQLIYIHYFVVMTLPPVFTKVFVALRYSTLYYLPRMFSVPNVVLMPSVPETIYNSVGDYNFLRNAGFTFTPLVVIIIFWALLKILSVPEINRFKSARIWCTTILQEKFKYAVILQWVAIFIVNTVFFACLQLRDYTIYSNFTLVSIVMAHISLFFFVFICGYVAYRVISFHYEHPTLSANLKKASDLILNSDEADQLVSTNIFLSQKKKIDIRSLNYPMVNNENIFPFKCIYRYNLLSLLCCNVLYLRAIVLSLIIALANSSVILQMSLAIPLNTLTLLYFIRARPYTFKFLRYRIRNYFAIFHEGCLIVLEILMLVLGTMDKNGSSTTDKQTFSNGIINYLTAVCSLTLIYHVFVTAVFIYRKIWLIFIDSDFFRANFPQKYAKYQAAKNKNKKLVKGIDPIAKVALKNLIKGYKKNRSKLRPTEEDMANPQLPVKYKITYFDRHDASSMGSKVSLSKSEKKKMLKDIFSMNEFIPDKEVDQYDEVQEDSEVTEPAYEEYEEEIEINVKDLPRYVANADELLKVNKADL